MKELKEYQKLKDELENKEKEIVHKKMEMEQKYSHLFLKKLTEILDFLNKKGVVDVIEFFSNSYNYTKTGIQHYDIYINAINSIWIDASDLTSSGEDFYITSIRTADPYSIILFETGLQIDLEDNQMSDLNINSLYNILITLLKNPLFSFMYSGKHIVNMNENLIKDFKSFISK